MTSIHPSPHHRRIAPAACAVALLACGAPDRPAASGSTRTFDIDPVPTRDTVVRALPANTPSRIQFDTTDYFAATAGANPDSVVRGRLPGSAVLDSVSLGKGATAVLVRLSPELDRNYGYFRVYVVEPGDGGRVARATNLEALGTVRPGRAAFGAADPDGDGRRDPYLASWTGGRGGFTVSLYLLDRRARDWYWYDLYGAWTYLDSRKGEFLDPSPPPLSVRRWMAAQAQRVADVADPDARDTVVQRHHAVQRAWRRDHGADFVQGPLRIRWHAGRPPLTPGTHCRTRAGDLEWLGDGDVWGYDRVRDRHFLLLEFGRFDYPNSLVPGARYLWMGSYAPADGGYGVVAYDRRRERISVIPVPELGRALPLVCGGPGRCGGGPQLSVRGGRLYGDTIALTLPDSIVRRAEFPDTGRVCTTRD